MEKKSYYCEKCRKTMVPEQFYTSNNLEKYPDDGKLKQCKKCITMHVDNWDPDTYMWILQEIDVPYLPHEWNKLLAKYSKNDKITGLTIIGRYLSKMKLTQYKEYRWADSERLIELENQKIEQTMKRQGYSAVEIAETIQKGMITIPDKPLREPDHEIAESGQPQDDYFSREDDNPIDMDLTEEDKTYLRLKWGKSYRPEEWVRLEQLYEEMMQSYDIQSAGHIDTLKLVCKTSLKANQLLDLGDVDGAQKMIKMYDGLMKSGKFTAQQNKAEKGEYVDSISELVAICEKDGFIPRFYVDGPQDKIDRVIQDMQEYTHNLITEEMHLGSLIERAVKSIEDDREREAELDDLDEDDEDAFERDLFDNEEDAIEDNDFSELKDFEEENALLDEELLNSLLEEDDE